MFRCRFYLIALALLVVAQTSRAQTIDDWRAQTKSSPSSALAYFNLGVTLHQEHRFEEALKAYEKVVSLGSSLAVVAKFYEAQIFEDQGDRRRAKETIAHIDIEKFPPNLKKKVLAFKNKIFLEDFASETDLAGNPDEIKPDIETKPSSEERAVSALLDLSFGRNSNPQTLADVSSNNIAADQQSQLKAGLNYLASASSFHELRIGYYGSGTFFQQAAGSNYYYHDMTLPFALYSNSFRIKFMPEFFMDNYGSSPFSQSYGGTLEATLKVDDAFVALALQDQGITNLNSSYSYLTGSLQKAQVSYQAQWSSSRFFATSAYSKLNYQDTATLASSYASLNASVGFTYLFLPFDVAIVGLIEDRLYNKATSDNFARNDFKYFGDVQLGWLMRQDLRLYVDVNQTTNTSNFNSSTNNRAYQQTMYVAGIAWTY